MVPHIIVAEGSERRGVREDQARNDRARGVRIARALHPGPLERLAARLRSSSLDQALIAGADPTTSALLAARAMWLTSPRTRGGIAAGLERSLRAAHGPQRRWWAVSAHSPLLANAAAVRELGELLVSDAPLLAPGIAMLNQLLTDGSGPAYHGQPRTVARLLRHAYAAMVA
jgi:hypothetical protein